MICAACGSETPDESVFCEKCGKPVNRTGARSAKAGATESANEVNKLSDAVETPASDSLATDATAPDAGATIEAFDAAQVDAATDESTEIEGFDEAGEVVGADALDTADGSVGADALDEPDELAEADKGDETGKVSEADMPDEADVIDLADAPDEADVTDPADGTDSEDASKAPDTVEPQHDEGALDAADAEPQPMFAPIDFGNPDAAAQIDVAAIRAYDTDYPLVNEASAPIQPELGRVRVGVIAVISTLFGIALVLLAVVVLMRLLGV